MANLHLTTVTVTNSTTLVATFSQSLSPDIGVENVTIESELNGVANATVLETSISTNQLTITCQPLVPLVSYYVVFQSTTAVPFISLNGNYTLYQDGNTNEYLILGPIEQENPIQTFLVNYLSNQIYDQAGDNASVIGSIIQSLSYVLSRALYDVRQVKNENYLSFTVNDEQKVRGTGPFDRLNEEAAYEILRVGLTPTNTSLSMSVDFPNFPVSPVSLLAMSYTELLTPSSTDILTTFNINDFVLTVSNQNVSILTSVVFSYTNGFPSYTYSIPTYGYQILDATYDQNYAFAYALLANNQFKLSASILSDPNFSLANIYQIQVSYQYRDLGRIIDPTSVEVTTVMQSFRETLPPLENVFNLQHAPITDVNGNPGSVGDITFIDPNAYPPSTPHPAFVSELVFNLAALPSNVGDYAVDYATGTVYVYGQDLTNSGTGPTPPLASYNYLYTYVSEIDYVYDPSDNNLVALPNGSLLNNDGSIAFDYEQVLIPGIDYNANLHIENLSENVQNRLLGLNVIQTLNTPVTNVFRIFNQTTGEVYNVTRWLNNNVYFTYNTAPAVTTVVRERATFTNSSNEILFVNGTLINSNNVQVYVVDLPNNQLIAGTQDGIASSIDTTTTFSNTEIFQDELWYDINETVLLNIVRLSIGQYMIDYANGIVYVGVINSQNIYLGTISYKTNSIAPVNPYVISVEDIYYQVNFANPKNAEFDYASFGNGSIVPASFDPSDEAYLNNNFTAPYQLINNQIGAYVDATFYPYVSNDIKYLRGIYEFVDLKYNLSPINFASSSTFSGQTITVNPLAGQQYTTVQHDAIDGYYALLNQNVSYQSANITFSFSVIRNSDSKVLWTNGNSLVLGYPLKFILPGTNSPHVNDAVTITYNISITNGSRMIVNYNKGEYYVDYTAVTDELIISYEYGDNYLDFSQSLSVSAGTQYYASYNVGALRDALQKNFGSLINIPDLDQFEITFERERYRDALTAALTSFLQGPTLTAMKNIVQTISHVEPVITESAFVNWSLGSSLLTPQNISTTGSFNLVPGKYNTGAQIDTPGQTITLPCNSNLRIEQGTFETWVIPEWNGIDNDAELTISIIRDGYIFPSNLIFIGAAEYHPTYNMNNTFDINKNNNVNGIPNKKKDGVYIYYAPDISGAFNRWFVEVIDGYSVIYNTTRTYTINISAGPGLFYDVKAITYPQSSAITIQSGTNDLIFSLNINTPSDLGITFVADIEHYLLDVGEGINTNRLSIYKDTGGYFNFRVYDKLQNEYSVSGNVSSWIAGEPHQVAAAWTLNTPNSRDEIHFFLDGFEVPNIIRYGTPVQPFPGETFRTINPEQIIATSLDNIVGSTDLVTVAGQYTVSSSVDFSAYGVTIGSTLYINESGFNGFGTSGYTITNVDGDTLTLSVSMPASITNGVYSVNEQAFVVQTPIDIYPNIAVSTISSIYTGNDGVVTGYGTWPNQYFTVYSPSLDFKIKGVLPGYLINIYNSNFATSYIISSISSDGHTVTIDNAIASENFSGAIFNLYAPNPIELPGVNALRPDYSVSDITNPEPVLTITNGVQAYDLILIETLGINSRQIQQTIYQWGSLSNILQTPLPPPVSLNQVDITHILLTATLISSFNSSPDGYGGYGFDGYQLSTDQPSPSNGRTLSITITSDDNLNFTDSPVNVTINGTTLSGSVTEVVTFTSLYPINTINTKHQFLTVNYVSASGVFNNANNTYMTLAVAEAYSITTPEDGYTGYPVLRYSYQTRVGNETLSGSGSTVTDPNGFFSSQDVENYLVISYPGSVAGTYQILSVSSNHLSATINASLPTFSGGSYQILNATTYRNGFQNGFFIFEEGNYPGVPYLLAQGTYQFEYYNYLSIKLSPLTAENIYIGSDFNGNNLIDAVIDETNIVAEMLSDTRIGEVSSANQESITKDFNSLKALSPNANTLVLCHYDTFPLINSADFYASTTDVNYLLSSITVNDNFAGSANLNKEPILIDNTGILNNTSGTIEFWVNPKFDTANDPNYRYYFDATSTVIENAISSDEITVSVNGAVGQVLSVTMQNGNPNIDYFAGGVVEIGDNGAVVEDTISLTASSVRVSQTILQVITVKIAGDPTNTDYFAGGNIGTDGVTIYLGLQLPNGNLALIVTYKPISAVPNNLNSQVIRLKIPLPYPTTNVVVTYIPAGLQGDRLSIFKDPYGYINFNIHASGLDYLVCAPIFWASNTWHRVRATYQLNSGNGTDTIRLFTDGYEHGNILFGSGPIFMTTPNTPYVFGSTFVGGSGILTNISFTDPINELYLGSSFTKTNPANVLIANCRFSDIARPVFAPYGESIDVNFNNNRSVVFPVTMDLYTTLLLNFANLTAITNNFTTLINPGNAFTFSVDVVDAFGIVSGSAIVKQVLTTLVNTLSPATSQVFLSYSAVPNNLPTND